MTYTRRTRGPKPSFLWSSNPGQGTGKKRLHVGVRHQTDQGKSKWLQGDSRWATSQNHSLTECQIDDRYWAGVKCCFPCQRHQEGPQLRITTMVHKIGSLCCLFLIGSRWAPFLNKPLSTWLWKIHISVMALKGLASQKLVRKPSWPQTCPSDSSSHPPRTVPHQAAPGSRNNTHGGSSGFTWKRLMVKPPVGVDSPKRETH